MFQFLGSAVLLSFLIYWLFIANLKTPKAIHGIYSKTGPWYYLKYLVFCFLLGVQKAFKSPRVPLKDGTHPFPEDNPMGNDSIFFIGSCIKSGLTFIVATERRPQNVTYGLVYLMVSLLSLDHISDPKINITYGVTF